MELLLAFVVAVGVTMALIPPLIKLAPRLQFVDVPQARKVHSNPVPRVGGIAMAAGLLIAWAVWGHLTVPNIALIAGIVVLLIFGVWDDRVTLSAGTKLIGQVIAVLIVMIFGGIKIGSITLSDRHVLPDFIALPLTFVFLVGVTNAINLADGLDGLAGGTTMMCLAGLALLAFTVANSQVGGAALLIIGVVLGFLRFNTYPARVFMGDSGSQLLGFSVAVLAVLLTQDATGPLSAALPLLLLGIPIIDTLLVMVERIAAGHSPFRADRNHIHHRLLALGFDHHEAVMAIYVAQSTFFVSAWFMRYEADVAIAIVFVMMAALFIAPLSIAKKYGWHWRIRDRDGRLPISRLRVSLTWLAAPERLPRWSVYAIVGGLTGFAISALSSQMSVPPDAALLAVACALAISVNLAFRWRAVEIGWVDKSVLYVSAVLLVFFSELNSHDHVILTRTGWVAIALMIAALAVRVRLSLDRRFVVTPLDVLVIIAAIIVPNLPDSIATVKSLGPGVAKLVVLFYAIETLSVVAQRHWKWLSVGALIVLAAMSFHALS